MKEVKPTCDSVSHMKLDHTRCRNSSFFGATRVNPDTPVNQAVYGHKRPTASRSNPTCFMVERLDSFSSSSTISA